MRSHVCSSRGTSCSTTRMPMPRRLAVDRIAAPSSPDSRLSRPAAGSSSSSTAGSVTSARAMPTRRETPWGSEDGRSSSTPPRPNSSTSSSTSGVAVRRPGRTRSTRYRQPDWSSAATSRLSRTVSSSNSSTACHERTIPARARRSTDQPSMGAPSKRDRARSGRREAGDDVEQRRLPGAVRSDEPDHLARLDLEADGVEGDDAAEGDGDVVRPRGWRPGAGAGPRPAAASGRGRGSWNGSVRRWAARAQRAAVPSGAWRSTVTAPRPDRIANHETMSVPSGTTFSKSGGAERARRADGGGHGARHPGEAADDGVLDQQDRPEDVVLAELHVGLPQRQQHPAEGGDGGGDAEGVHLGGHDADAERGGGPLVAPHREQPDARPGPGAGWRRGGRRGRARRARSRRSAAGCSSGSRSMPANDTPSIGRPRTPPVTALLVNSSELNISAMARVATARLVPRVRTAGRATTTPTSAVPDHRREQRGLERPAVGRHEPSRHPRPDAGEGELAQRELPGVAGDDDDRRDDDGEGERGDEGVGPGVDAGEEAGADGDPDDEREQRHPPGPGQRQPGDGLAPLEARPAGHDHVAEDDRQRHGLHEPGERRRADVEPRRRCRAGTAGSRSGRRRSAGRRRR